VNTQTTKKSGKHAEVKNLTGLMIRQFREKRGWTQYQLADSFRKMGVPITRCIIANIETQRCPVTDCQLALFARILGVSWKSLFPDKTIMEKFVPHSIPIQKPEHGGKIKRSSRNPTREASRKQLEISEMTCKSVKITFRHPS
jgi:transcriptional regulator with XRE-family HTH domain